MLQLHQIEKSYDGRRILSIPAMGLEKGVYWLQGANGSGKTTLLRMIAGLMPFKGDIRLRTSGFGDESRAGQRNGAAGTAGPGECSLRDAPLAYRRGISWADAEPLYPDFIKGRDLVAFYREIRQASAIQVDHLIGLFAVGSWLGAPVGTYSSGMIKKLSLLLAFIGAPSLILLDEPLVTLDKDSIPHLYTLIAGTYREKGTSFIITSHQDLATGELPDEKILLVKDQSLHLIA